MRVSLFSATAAAVAATRIELQRPTTQEAHLQYLPTVAELNRLYGVGEHQASKSFLGQDVSMLQQQLVSRTKAMHALQYFGEISVGGQNFNVIFDSGSGHLLVPGPKCESPACMEKGRRVYNMNASHDGTAVGWTDEPETAVAEDSEDRDVTTISFATGEVIGNYYRDKVCLAANTSSNAMCGMVDFIAMQEESDNPFKGAQWDGVLGLGLDLSDTPEFAVLTSIFNQTAKTKQVTTKHGESFLQKDFSNSIYSYYLHNYGGEINFGQKAVRERINAGAREVRANVTVEGYWQFAIEDITINGKRTGLCANYTGGVCQGVVDTGSSLIMAPGNLLGQLTQKLNVDDKCKRKDLPTLGFLVKDASAADANANQTLDLSLEADEYLDRDEKECLISMMSIGDTGRGPIIVLGYPFLRNWYTMFDFDKKQLGFVSTKNVKQEEKEAGIVLKGIRPTP